jgi:hypothetical protein
MTKRQLIEKLNPYPDNMDVFMAERKTKFAFGLVNSVRQQKIKFADSPNFDIAIATISVVILDEE